MHLLLKDKISLIELKAAKIMIEDFCVLLEELYGTINCTHTSHLLTHLVKHVRL